MYGGVKQGRQVESMKRGADVVVATPGRLLDLVGQGHVDLSGVRFLVLDEADRMLDMGFIHDIRKVVDLLPERRQTMFFSATLSREVRSLAETMLVDPARVETTPDSVAVDSIRQEAFMVERKNRLQLLKQLLKDRDVGKVLIFTRTKHGAGRLAKQLWRAGIGADAIHGNKSQNARFRALDAFRSGEKPILVATDIASRGIDVDDITHVINYDMPIDEETYVHRIGRTARAGASGVAIAFCGKNDRDVLRAIRALPGNSLKEHQGLPLVDEDLDFADYPASIRRKASRKTIAKERARDEERIALAKRNARGKSGKKPGDRKSARTGKSGDRKGKGAGSASGRRKNDVRDRDDHGDERPASKRRRKTGKAAKIGKAKWKARAATAGKKGKLPKARKRKNSQATPGHRGSPGYKKKVRPKKGGGRRP